MIFSFGFGWMTWKVAVEYPIGSQRQTKRDDPGWKLRVGLTTFQCKMFGITKLSQRP
jgi:hypothetical protein